MKINMTPERAIKILEKDILYHTPSVHESDYETAEALRMAIDVLRDRYRIPRAEPKPTKYGERYYHKYFRFKEEMDAAFEKIQRIIKEQGRISHRQYLRCCGIEDPDHFHCLREQQSKWDDLTLVWYNGSDFDKGILTIGGKRDYYIWANVHPQTPKEG